jgi:hypothetical protein
MVGNRLKHREEASRQNMSPSRRNIPRHDGGTRWCRSPHKEISPHCHYSPRRSSRSQRSRSPYHDESPDTVIARNMKEETNNPGHQGMPMATKMRKLRWGRHALPTGFRESKYPKDSSYPLINKITTDRKSPSHGYQITFRL